MRFRLTQFFLSLSLLSGITNLCAQHYPSLIPYRDGDKWGYCDSTQQIILQPRYEEAELFRFGLALVDTARVKAVIDTTGKLYWVGKYDELEPYSSTRIRVRKGKRWGMVDLNGKIIVPCKYKDRLIFQHQDSTVIFWNGKKFGGFDLYGNPIIPFNLYHVEDFGLDHGLFWVGNKEDNRHGFLDKKGKVVIPLVYWRLELLGKSRFIGEADHGWDILDFNGKSIKHLNYEWMDLRWAHNPPEGLIQVRQKRDGFIDTTGKEIIPCIFYNVEEFHNGLCLASSDSGKGYINKTGKAIVPLEYYECHEMGDSTLECILMRKIGRVDVFDRKGKKLRTINWHPYPPVIPPNQ
ncbi:MAG TPA: WG repeat-containing protein, partial [Bacteroidia bacterium]|nr:WG repeat-containing protein [Bacteroidia bacterium]